MTQPKALVTGATGFIGRRLCRRLVDAGWRVHAITRTPVRVDAWTSAVVADLAEATSVEVIARELQPDLDVMFHLAGRAHVHDARATASERQAFHTGNVATTTHAVALAHAISVRRFILAGSVAAVGDVGDVVADESHPCSPTTDYGQSKLEAERVVAGAALDGVVLRLPMVIGGRERGNMSRMIDAVRRRRFLPFPETGNRRSIVHVDDAVDAMVLAAIHPAARSETFIVTDGVHYSTRQIYETILAVLGRPRPRMTPPLFAYRVAARFGDLAGAITQRRMPLDTLALEKLAGSAAFSNAKITQMLGFRPRRTLAEGVRATVEEQR